MPEALEETSPSKFLATLVRGECHYLREIRFDHGIPTVVLDYHREHLLEHAVETVEDSDGEVAVKDKFSFKPYAGPLDVGATIGTSGALRGDTDPHTADRLRSFGEKEAARLRGLPPEASTAPAFDPAARRAEVEERSRKVTEEDPALPRARPPRFPLPRASA